MTALQPITYRGQLAALAGPDRFFLSERLDRLHVDHPERRMVIHMCLCAHDIATANLPGPYTDQSARRYARGCLLTPGLGELLERDRIDIPRAARALRIPADELHLAVAEHRQRLERVSRRPT